MSHESNLKLKKFSERFHFHLCFFKDCLKFNFLTVFVFLAFTVKGLDLLSFLCRHQAQQYYNLKRPFFSQEFGPQN